ncbi:MAG TPA: adenylyltransferase/cytidyltransferase family protein [Candidatus Paceibacterota bacterium]|jgi:D-beta-D-heptose 7-phosphate kinase/D-beta-D-heptose 1-phosphate adenosyltransferase|nr:adenylyltransferase/cytidyltransferase family protein [Candidatus Paceibacterota bacterium]
MSKKVKKVVMVSGGFDPVHIGHVRMFKEAKKLGDELVVVLNNDNWLMAKKGFVFMPEADRKEILEAFRAVDRVVLSSHKKNAKDMSIRKYLEAIHPDIFANGGDRNEKDSRDPKSSLYKDINLCKKLGIEIVYNVGRGGKVRSSSELVKSIRKHIS